MWYAINATDAEESLERRLAVRSEHVALMAYHISLLTCLLRVYRRRVYALYIWR